MVGGPLPVALIPQLDHPILHLKPQAEEGFQLGDSDRHEVFGVVCSGLGLLPEICIKEQLKEGKCSALVVDVVWEVLGAYVVWKELCVYTGHSLTSPC